MKLDEKLDPRKGWQPIAALRAAKLRLDELRQITPGAAEAQQAEVEKLTADILRQHFANGLEAELLETFAKVREIYDRVVK